MHSITVTPRHILSVFAVIVQDTKTSFVKDIRYSSDESSRWGYTAQVDRKIAERGQYLCIIPFRIERTTNDNFELCRESCKEATI
jgi:hypothetical protein